MFILVISLIILFAVLLVLVILAQNSKGGGLTSQFGGSSASNIIGVKKTGDLLEKLTWGFIIVIMVLALSTNLLSPNIGGGTNDILDRAGEQAPATPAPNLNDLAPESADSGHYKIQDLNRKKPARCWLFLFYAGCEMCFTKSLFATGIKVSGKGNFIRARIR